MTIRILMLLFPLICVSCANSSLTSTSSEEELINGKYKVVKTETGKMSWYSVKTNYGTATASGEKFCNFKPTAAHKKLKMGTMVRVTNLKNGKSSILRINDRGPYKPGRIIDVAVGMSKNEKLAFYKDGVVPCKVEVLEEISEDNNDLEES
ncbi:septal ring lytic transglycosylase RlpA family protein [Rubritalea halochordaticola]